MKALCNDIWLVVSNMNVIFPFDIWDVIFPIDGLHHFSRWLSHHQAGIMGKKTWIFHHARLIPFSKW